MFLVLTAGVALAATRYGTSGNDVLNGSDRDSYNTDSIDYVASSCEVLALQ